jgi:hypothetical protein
MKTVIIEVELKIEGDVSEQHIMEFVNMELCNGTTTNNPLHNGDAVIKSSETVVMEIEKLKQ